MTKIHYIKTTTVILSLIIVFLLSSCGVNETTSKTGGTGANDNGYDVLFSLTGANTHNFSAVTVSNATYTYAPNDSFTLTATKTSLSSSTNTDNFFHYTVTSTNVLNITGTTTNSITFALTNMEPGVVLITAIATNNLGQTNGEHTYTINLQKASYPVATPPIVYVTTNQAGITGAVLIYGVQTGSDKRSTYQNTTVLTNISGSATAGIATNGTVTVTNGVSGTSVFEVRLTSPNYVDYVVSIISESVTTDVRFSLTGANTNHFSAVTVSNATYTYAPNDSFTLTASKTNLSSYAYSSNFFHYTVSPANVLNITGTTTNSITFALTNMEPGVVLITAIATNNLGQTNGEYTYTISLRKASYPTPPITYVTTNQAGANASVLTYAVQSDNRNTYQYITALIKKSGSATAGIGSDGTVTVTNGSSGTSVFEVRLTSPNYVDYVVRIISELDTTEVRFSLTGANTDNFSVVTATSAIYTYAPNDSFTLTATKTNLSSSAYSSNFFHYTVSPANVLNITATTTNSITFALTNMEPGVVLITAIATNNLGQTTGEHTYTINLQKASYPVATPPIVYVTTNQAGITGAVLIYGVQTGSDKRSTYQNTTVLTNISGSAIAGIATNGTVTVTNGVSGTSVFEVRLTSPNYVNYVASIISEPATTDVRFSLTGANTNHFSAVTVSNATYTYAPNDSFTLTATKTNLSSSAYASNFFHYTVSPASVLNITGITTNSITFALTNMEPGSVRITAIATNNLGQTNRRFTYTISLRKSTLPRMYVTTKQTGVTGAVLTYAVQTGNPIINLRTSTIKKISGKGSATASISADGTVMVTKNEFPGTSVFEVKLTSPNYVDYTVRITNIVVSIPVIADRETIRLFTIISNGVVPTDLGSETDPLVKNTLAHLGGTAGAYIKVIYVTEAGSGDLSGNNWTNALPATNLRTTIRNISDANANKPYLVLIGEGIYKTTYATIGADRNLSFTMKNHTAIIGGFNITVNANANNVTVNRGGTTTFSGDIGTANDNIDNTYNVFRHRRDPLNNGVLYGVTVTGGNADASSFPDDSGGGMFNATSSAPVLTRVVFSSNSAKNGGGMYNLSSSPVLTGVVFSGNSAKIGGGMLNNRNSAPVLTGVVFTGNSATINGGGMYNEVSAPVLVGVVFTGNRATQNGGGMYNDNDAKLGPLIVNAIFAENTAGSTGNDIVMNLSRTNIENIRIGGSVLGIRLANPTNAIAGAGGTSGINITYHSLANGAVNFGTDATAGGIIYPTIQSSSSAMDIGLYVRRDGNNYYFSEDSTTWYTAFTDTSGLTGPAGAPPATAIDLTARDIAGNIRVGRPDAGVYEYKP